MVQVGYKYYSQCYDLKKKKLEEMAPTYKDIDRFGSKNRDSSSSHNGLNQSVTNVRNAEIYLQNGGPDPIKSS